MKRFIAFCIIALIGFTAKARADTLNLRIVDQSGIPIAGVTITYSYTGTPPAHSGSGTRRTDLNGEASIQHPGLGGSSCILFSHITYNIGYPGVTFSKNTGIVSCGPLTSAETVTALDFPSMANVSSASYRQEIAGEMIAAMFGVNLADTSAKSASAGLAITLAGRQVLVRDISGVEKPAELIYVSPTQINYILPGGLVNGATQVRLLTVEDTPVSIASGIIEQASVAPGLYSANANGQGVAAAVIQRVHSDGTQKFEPIAKYDQDSQRFVALPVDLGPETDQVFLILFGTGWRFRSSLGAVMCTIGGMDSEVTYAGAQGEIAGLDQANVRLSRTLAGRGGVDIVLLVDGKQANMLNFIVK